MISTIIALLPSNSRGAIARHLVLAVLGVILRAVGVVLLVPVIEALFSGDPATAWPWVGAFAAVTATGWLVDAAAARAGFALGFSLLDTGQRTVADRISQIRLDWLSAGHLGTTRRAVAATGPDLVGLIIYLVTPIIGAVLLPVAIGVALLWIAWPIGLAALAGVVFLGGALWASGRLTRDADRAAEAANAVLTERVVEFARTQQALRASRRVEPARNRASEAVDSQYGAIGRLLLLQVPGQVIFGLASQVALLLLAVTTVVLTVQGQLSASAAVALIVVIVRYLEPFTVLADLSPGIEGTLGTLRTIREVLEAPVNPSGSMQLAADAAPRIELRDVSFSYGEFGSGDEPAVLEQLSIDLAPGTTTAIVGPSGSGKSTILALLAGLQSPTAGQVLFDGVDLATVTETNRHQLVSMVFQHPYLFDGSIRDNVLAGNPAASDQAVTEVARLARIDALVTDLPDGWSSRVGEAGGGLSGGERQRVSIARALLNQAPVLLVDEATSALDTENEAAVAAALTNDQRPRTRIIVAHRLSSIRAADRVIFVERGKVVEDGRLEDLLAAGGRLADFWSHQMAADSWQLRHSEV